MVEDKHRAPRKRSSSASLAADWWDPDGASAMLHKLNPVRLEYIRDQIDQHWQSDERSRAPLEGKTALDVGCGAGLLAEPLARLGAKVTAIDAAPELIAVARGPCAGAGARDRLSRRRRSRSSTGKFDLVTCLEVIEHVADPRRSSTALPTRLAPGGLLILSTPNRTGWSKLLTITLGGRPRPDPQGHARFRQVHRARPDEGAARRRGPQVPRRRGHRLVADARPAPQRRRAAELSGRRRTRLTLRLDAIRERPALNRH